MIEWRLKLLPNIFCVLANTISRSQGRFNEIWHVQVHDFVSDFLIGERIRSAQRMNVLMSQTCSKGTGMASDR